jgi:hypothetical protein
MLLSSFTSIQTLKLDNLRIIITELFLNLYIFNIYKVLNQINGMIIILKTKFKQRFHQISGFSHTFDS